MCSKITSELVTPSESKASTIPSKPLITVVAARMPQRPWGATVNPLAFNVRALDLESPVLLENSAKFILSSSKESPSARAISEMALSIISCRPLRSLSFMVLLIFWRIGVHQCRADGGAVAVFS